MIDQGHVRIISLNGHASRRLVKPVPKFVINRDKNF